MRQFIRQAQLGTRLLAPIRLANELAFDFGGVDEIADAVPKPAQEEPRRRCPVPDEEGRLVDDAVPHLSGRQDRARPLAAAARIEIVAVEIEQHDARPLNPLKQRIEPRRIETPEIVELVEIPKGRRCRRHYRIHLVRCVGRHQGEEGAKGLPGEHDVPVALAFQLADLIDQTARAGAQRVAVARPVEAEHIPARIAQYPQIRGCRQIEIFDIDRASVVPDNRHPMPVPGPIGSG